MRKLFALLSVLSLTGCAAQEPAPTITPVDLKYCAVSDTAGYNDDGLNRSVYAALQQLKVQIGAAVSAVEVSDKLNAATAIQKLVDAKCNAIVTSGAQLVNATLAAAKKNSSVRFYSVSDSASAGFSTSNYSALTFNIFQAAYAAGYLAAATSEASPLPNPQFVNVIDKLKTSTSKKASSAFVLGATRYNSVNKKEVPVTATNVDRGEAIVFGIAGNAKQLGLSVSNSSQLPRSVIGFGRDWYLDVRNKDMKNAILTSVIRIDAIGKVVDAVVNNQSSQHFDLSNNGVGLADAHDVNWPIGFNREMSQMIKDFQDGKVKVD